MDDGRHSQVDVVRKWNHCQTCGLFVSLDSIVFIILFLSIFLLDNYLMGHDFLVIILTLDLGFKQYSINCRANLPCPNDMWYNRSHLSSPRKPSKIPFHHTQVWRPWKGGGPYTMWIEYQYLKLQNCLGNYNNKKEKNEEGGGGWFILKWKFPI